MEDGTSKGPTDEWVVWEILGKPVAVRLKMDVVGRLGMAVGEGFKALPRRGLETGGLLLGTKTEAGGRVVVQINDFEPVECEHAAGPSYLLSDEDRRLLEKTIAAREAAGGNSSIVGIYRSHTRRDFAISMEDDFLFSTYFRKASDVFLLIKRNDDGPPTGGFVIREDGKVLSRSPYAQFPLRPARVAPAARVTPAPEPQTPREPPRAAQNVQPAATPQSIWTWRRPIWIATASAIALAAILFFGIQRHIPDSKAAAPEPPLALNVISTGNGLRLSWNHLTPRQTRHAVLWITDGREEQRFELDSRQLAEGSVAYWPRSSDVTFRLELVSDGATVAETVRSIGGPSKELVDLPVAAPAQAAGAGSRSVRAASAAEAAAVKESPVSEVSPPQPLPDSTGTASRQVSRTFALPSPEANPAAMAPAPLPDPPTIQPMVVPPPERSNEFLAPTIPANSPSPRVEAGPSFRVRVEPVADSRLGHLARNIPLIGKRYRRQDYVPPAPLRSPAPADSPRRAIARDVNIDVKVYVNPTGKVDYSEVLSSVVKEDRDLAALAMFSARRWEFVPARIGDDTVPGEVILHYQFGPGAQAAGNAAVAGR
jgi:hypothetical protein